MLAQTIVAGAALMLVGTTRAAPGSLPMLDRSAEICYTGESAKLDCYNPPNGTPQHVNVSDVAYIAEYLRAYGETTRAGVLFSMSVADAPDCAEWTLYSHGSALATAKHINSAVNSSVLYTDIANTIDGGVGATAAQQAAALIGCGSSGGSLGVQYNASNPAYHASTYPAHSTPKGIMIKIVSSSNSSA